MKSFSQFLKEEEEDKRPIASFDFDDTIFSLQWDPKIGDYERDDSGSSSGKLNHEIAETMDKYKADGWKVILVTSRPRLWLQEVKDFCREHAVPVDEYYSTNFEYKAPILKKLGVQIHYDDDNDEIDKIKEEGIKTVKVVTQYERITGRN